MRAEAGRVYAQIIDGKCHVKFTDAELPEWNNDQCPAVDVTGSEPDVGDLWDGMKFEKPPAEAPKAVTKTKSEKLVDLLLSKGVLQQSDVDSLEG